MDDMNYNLVMLAVRDLKDANDKQGVAIEKLAQALTQAFQDAATDRSNQAKFAERVQKLEEENIIERLRRLEEEVAKLKPAS